MFWVFEALQRRKQLQRPHQTQHSAPPESGDPTRLAAVLGQGPQSAGAGNRPPPNSSAPRPRHTSCDGEKVAAGSSPRPYRDSCFSAFPMGGGALVLFLGVSLGSLFRKNARGGPWRGVLRAGRWPMGRADFILSGLQDTDQHRPGGGRTGRDQLGVM
uniref:Uncharacterized protein n=1 Tax=Mastacembelus armatus TaxID=205130 RepID=A0A3Q3L754_9TELE